MNWCVPQTSGTTEEDLFCPARDAIENFILMGGKTWGRVISGDRNLLEPRWEPKSEGYVAPEIPDEDRPADDPARNYEEDEFDA